MAKRPAPSRRAQRAQPDPLRCLVQIYVAQPGASLDEKAARVGVRRNALLRAARGTISRTTRLRLLAFFAGAAARRVKDARVPAGRRAHRQRKRGFT